MIDLICEDGHGPDGMRWGGTLHVMKGGDCFAHWLVNPYEGHTGRKAKRLTRQRMVERADAIIATLPDFGTSQETIDKLDDCVL